MEHKPWQVGLGFTIGILVGVATWWSAFEPAMGLLQNLQLIVVPAALGILIVILRNKWRGIGRFNAKSEDRSEDDGS